MILPPQRETRRTKHRLIVACLLAGLACLPAPARRQAPAGDAPFAAFDREVRAQRAGYAGDKSHLSRFFNDERRRLGARFEGELLKYVAGDAEKHYWLSLFLVAPDYLHGSRPLPRLAYRLKRDGLALVRGKDDRESRAFALRLNVSAALLSDEMGLAGEATRHKDAAEELLANDSQLEYSFPGMGEKQRRRYDAIKSRYTTARFRPRPEGKPRFRVSAGLLNGKAKRLPAPPPLHYLNREVVVKVEVVVDEAGKVTWARGVEGHPLLYASAVQAARGAEFEPLVMSGRPVSFGGYLIYKFPKGK